MPRIEAAPKRPVRTPALVAALGAAVLLELPRNLGLSLVGLGVAVLALRRADPQTLRELGRLRFWLTGLALAALSGLLLGKRVETVLGLHISPDGLATGVMIVVRAAVFLAALMALAKRLSADQLVRFFARIGAPEAGASVAIGMRLVPQMIEAWGGSNGSSGSPRPPVLDRMTRMLFYAVNMADAIAADSRAWIAPRHEARICCLTGPIGSGKTVLLDGLIRAASERGLRTAGFVQRAVMAEGRKVGYDLRLFPGEAAIPLARRAGPPPEPGYRFDLAAFRAAEAHLDRAERVDLWIADEIGLLEQAGEGHWPALARILPARGGTWVLSVRSGLADMVVARLGYPEWNGPTLTLPAPEAERRAFVDAVFEGEPTDARPKES